MSRWQLAVAGTAVVGATVVVAWVLLLPYTMGQRTTSPLLDSLRQRWAESRSQQPAAQPLPLARARAEARRQPTQRLVEDAAGRFVLLVPDSWVDVAAAAGAASFGVGSTTVSFAYPAQSTLALPGASAAAAMDGAAAVRSAGGGRVQVVAQLGAGYAVLLAEGPEAELRSDELLAGVYFNR